jgi:hypothetical protein
MIELRNAGKDVMQGDVQSAKNANKGEPFGRLQKIFILRVIAY